MRRILFVVIAVLLVLVLSCAVAGRTPDPAQAPAQRRSPPTRKGCTVAAQPSSNTAADTRNYLRTAEVADILHVSPKTVSRWAKEGKLPFLRTLGGHRRYSAAQIRQLADELQVRPTA
jgi:excisionase family DNA binding protein